MQNGVIVKCCACNKVKDHNGQWRFEDMTNISFFNISHGICEDCLKNLYPEYAEIILNRRNTQMRYPYKDGLT